MKQQNKIPEGWQETLVGEKIKILPGYAFSSKNFNLDGRGLPLIRIRDIDNNQTECFYDGSFEEEYLVKKRDILIGMDGEFNVNRWSGKRALLNQRVCKIYPLNDKEINADYLYYLIQDPIKKIELQVGQTTVKHLSTKDLFKIKIPLPQSITEQTAIAHVISTVDSQIERVERERRATERLRSGIMSKLLGGKWAVVKFDSLINMKRGFSYRSNQISKDFTEVSFLTINNFSKEGGMKVNAEKIFLKEETEIDESFFVRPNDLFIANTDMSKGLIIGAPLLINELEDKIVFSMDLTKLNFDRAKINQQFLFYFLKSDDIRRIMKMNAQGTNVLHLNHDLVKSIEIPLPPLTEQKKIAEILRTIDHKLDLETQRKDKLEKIKRGLMDELLTGKKRVNVDNILGGEK